MEHQQQSEPTPPANVHPSHDAADANVAGAIRAGAFIPGPTPLQIIEARQRFIAAMAVERAHARNRGADRRAR